MSRRPNPKIRNRLRKRAIDYVLKNGYSAVSLRPMAKALKTNARMLIYHFGSREGLMQEILAGLRQRENHVIQEWFDQRKEQLSLAEFLRWYWQRMSSPEARPIVLLIFELYALALRNPKSYPGVLTNPVEYWRGLATKAGAEDQDHAAATLLLGATRGLLLDLTATGDKTRITKALNLLAKCIEHTDRKGEDGPPS